MRKGWLALVEKHYVSKRSRRQKGVLAFLAQDAQTRVFCYANGQLRKDLSRLVALSLTNTTILFSFWASS
ncbi:MAG: hypothetical protein ACLQNE_22875 [Thermoguttaceae bacterium]|jgi:hypothetical protein